MALTFKPFWLIFPISLLLFTTGLCQSSDYHARYSTSYGPIFASSVQTATPDSGIVLVGFQNTVYAQNTSGLMVMKVDHWGNVVWAKAINTGGQMGYSDPSVCAMSDGSVAVALNVTYDNNNVYTNNILLVKLNCRGQVLWCNSSTVQGSSGSETIEPMSLKEGANSDLLLSFFNYSANPYMAICRVDVAGAMLWSKIYNAPSTNPNVSPNVSDHYTPVIFYNNNIVTVFGLKNEYENAINYSRQIFAMQLNYSDGSMVRELAYDYNEINTGGWGYFGAGSKTDFEAEQLTDGTYALFGIFTNYSPSTFYLYRMIVNPDLSVNQTQAFAEPESLMDAYGGIRVLPNGETHITFADYNTSIFYWYAADKSGNIIRQVQIPYPGIKMNAGTGGDVLFQTGLAQSAYSTNMYDPNNNGWYIDVTQATDGGNAIAACLGTPANFISLQSWQVTTGTWNWVSTASDQVGFSGQTYSEADMSVSKTYMCAPQQPQTTGFKITGPSAVCTSSTADTFRVITGFAGYKPVQWTMDPSLYDSLKTVNDSTVVIVFKNASGAPYAGKLYASGGLCSQAMDSVTVTIYPGATLPRSATICTQPIVLHPGYWFSAYLWQDGSTDSVYTITKPGRYTLQLQTACGATLTDTIEVYGDRIGGIGPVTMCQHDTALLKAPGGFTNYSWGPPYDLTPVNDTLAEVYPQTDTVYVLSSSTVDGCPLHDSIAVSVHKAPVVSLGADTLICQLDQLTLNAGNGYSAYLWSTGATTPSIRVGPPGTFSVTVTNAEGCRTSDTIEIQGKYCPDLFAVPNAFTPGEGGANRLFKPHIEGPVAEYQFTVYNRWGAVVFETKDPSAGWDGNLHGETQPAGTYAWMCRYQFSGDGVKMDKGTVILIR